MISNIDIKNEYIKLYKLLRNYIWHYSFIESLVEFEDAILVRFPSMSDVRNKFNDLYTKSKLCREQDTDLQNEFLFMKDLLENNECTFSYLATNVKE